MRSLIGKPGKTLMYVFIRLWTGGGDDDSLNKSTDYIETETSSVWN